MKKRYFGVPCLLFLAAGCMTTLEPSGGMTPLEIQSLQTREYENKKGIVFASVVSVFQDLGYTLKSADKDTGFITAESVSKSDVFRKTIMGLSSVSQTSATAFIEQIGARTRVRLNFVAINRTSSVHGQTDRTDIPILDADTYQNAFERIENAIFIRSAN